MVRQAQFEMSNIAAMLAVALTLAEVGVERVDAIHECDSLFVSNVFRCATDKNLCLSTTDVVCREPLLNGIYVQCPDSSNQWRGLCNRICYTSFRISRGFRCGDGRCITDFMRWCDGKVDCPNDDADEAYCNCTARPSDCRHWATDSHRTFVSSQYLFRRVFAPLGFFVVVLVFWKYYRTLKLRQQLASLHGRGVETGGLCDPDAVYVGGVEEIERRRRFAGVVDEDGAPFVAAAPGGQGPPPYSSTDFGPPPYPPDGSGEPPPYQEFVPPPDPADLRVRLPPIVSPSGLDLPPPPSYDSVAAKPNKDDN